MKSLSRVVMGLSKNQGSRGFTLVIAVLSCVIAMGFASAVLTSAYSNYMRTVLNKREGQLELYALSGVNIIRNGLEGAELNLETVEAACEEDASRNRTEAICGDISITGEPWVGQLLKNAYEGGGSFTLSAEIMGSDVEWDCAFIELGKKSGGIPDENSLFNITVKCRAGEAETEKTLSVHLSVSVSSYTKRRLETADGREYNYIYTYRIYRYIFV